MPAEVVPTQHGHSGEPLICQPPLARAREEPLATIASVRQREP